MEEKKERKPSASGAPKELSEEDLEKVAGGINDACLNFGEQCPDEYPPPDSVVGN